MLAARNPHPHPPGTAVVFNIRIPPRPFIQPTLDKWGKPRQVAERVQATVAREMKGVLGR